MKYEVRNVTEHKVSLSNGVTFTRETVKDVLHTIDTQIENQKTVISNLTEERNKAVAVLDELIQDRGNFVGKITE